MTRRYAAPKQAAAAALLLGGTIFGSVSFVRAAEDAAPPPPPAPRAPRGGGFMRFGAPTAAEAPIAVLDSDLKLTADQKTQITKLQEDYVKSRQDLFARPAGDSGGPPDQATMQANMEKMRTLQQDTAKKIEAVLTSDQKTALPDVLKTIGALRTTGIPAETYGDLKLTGDQKKRLTELAATADKEMQDAMQKARDSGDFASVRTTMQQSRQQTHDKALKILSEDQGKTVEQYRKDHPQPQGRGGFGGRRGPGGA